MRGWKSLKKTRPRVPVTWRITQALILTALARGSEESGLAREVWWAAGLAFWLAFECLLRPGEALKLLVQDLIFPEEGDEEQALVVIIRDPKTKRIWQTQFVLCKDGSLIAWLAWWCSDRKPTSRLFPLSRSSWSNMLVRASHSLGLSGCRFTPASFRSGGATHRFKIQENLPRLQYHGRWRVARTLEHYLHEAFSALIMLTLSADSKKCLEVVLSAVHRLSAPPRKPVVLLLAGA